MRRPSKSRIAQALDEYTQWRASVDNRLANILPEGASIVRGWADDVRSRIADGELGICTTALARSVVRAIEDFESGFYVGVTDGGGFRCRA